MNNSDKQDPLKSIHENKSPKRFFFSPYRAILGHDIFISYSRKDSLDYAYAISQYFMKKGYDCYIDQLSSITPGKALPTNIRNAVRRSTAFVLIGSEGAQLSEPIQTEVQLFLDSHKNKPLIPVSIDGAINNAKWYTIVEGLALINELGENVKAGKPSQAVLDRIENSLQFTRKSTRLKRVAMATLLSVMVVTVGMSIYASKKSAEAIKAINKQKVADREKNNAVKAKDQAQLATNLAKGQLAAISRQEDSIKNELTTTTKAKTLLDKKMRIQELLYKARTEFSSSNASLAFQYGKDAMELESDIPGSNYAIQLMTDYLNNFTPKYINDTLMYFSYKSYFSALDHTISEMRIFDLNADKTQVFAFYTEPDEGNWKRMKMDDYRTYCELWRKKHFTVGLIDIKGDSLMTLGPDKGKNFKNLNLYGYYFSYSPQTEKFYLITDTCRKAKTPGPLVLIRLDDHLNVISEEPVNSIANDYLRALNDATMSSDLYYIHSFNADPNKTSINLMHFGNPSTISTITLDMDYGTKPVISNLQNLVYDTSDYNPPDFRMMKNVKMTGTDIFYIAGNALYVKNLSNGTEKEILGFKKFKAQYATRDFEPQYTISPKLNMVFMMDSTDHVTIMKKAVGNVWHTVSSLKFEQGISAMEFDEETQSLIIFKNDEYSRHSLKELIKEPAVLYLQEIKYDPHNNYDFNANGMNYHFNTDNNNIRLVNNNDRELKKSIETVKPDLIKYSIKERSLLCLNNTSASGGVSVTDLSNLMLPEIISDDSDFNDHKFIELGSYPHDTIPSIKNNRIKIHALSGGGFNIEIRNHQMVGYPLESFSSDIDFPDHSSLIFFITKNREMDTKYFFHSLDIVSGNRERINISEFLANPSDFQITKKYIYFRETDYVNHEPRSKMIRIVNPAISSFDLTEILRNSIF